MPFLQNTGMYRFLYLTFTCQKAVINFEVTITSKQHTLHKYRIAYDNRLKLRFVISYGRSSEVEYSQSYCNLKKKVSTIFQPYGMRSLSSCFGVQKAAFLWRLYAQNVRQTWRSQISASRAL